MTHEPGGHDHQAASAEHAWGRLATAYDAEYHNEFDADTPGRRTLDEFVRVTRRWLGSRRR